MISEKLDERLRINQLVNDAEKNIDENRMLTLDLCQNDWKFFVNNFLWIQDPEALTPEGKDLPFILWDYQERAGDEIVKAIEEGYDLPIEKCRKLGLTWLVLAILTWGWHFKEWDVLIGSSKAQNADVRGDMGTLFEKIRYMVRLLPNWIFVKKFDHYNDKVMMLKHPVNNATIVGEGNNPNFGRSDRRKVIFLDEFSSWETVDRAAYQGCSATTKCRIAVSTPNTRGVNCYFYQVINDHRKKGKPMLTLTWDMHPYFAEGLRDSTEHDLAFTQFNLGETSPWLEGEIARASDNQSVAQEILINYEASMAGKVFGEFRIDVNVSEDAVYDEDLPLYVAWDFGLDQTAMIWIQPDRYNGFYNIIDEYVSDGTRDGDNIYHYINVLESKGYKAAIHFGDPHSGENRSLTSGQSNATILRRQGIIFKSERTNITSRIAAARNILSQVRVNPNNTLIIEMFSSWQMRRPRSGSTHSAVPDHSIYSHLGDAFTYFAYNFKKTSNNFFKKKKVVQSLSGVSL